MKFALSKDHSLSDPPNRTVKEYKHVECGKTLVPASNHQWLCTHCMQAGFLVRIKVLK